MAPWSVVDFTTGMAGLLDTVDTTVGLLTDWAQLDLVADLLRIQSRLAGVLTTSSVGWIVPGRYRPLMGCR
ncbi:MAG: hypothetical protein R2719_11500 [Micropruina sp.]